MLPTRQMSHCSAVLALALVLELDREAGRRERLLTVNAAEDEAVFAPLTPDRSAVSYAHLDKFVMTKSRQKSQEERTIRPVTNKVTRIICNLNIINSFSNRGTGCASTTRSFYLHVYLSICLYACC